MADLVTLVLSNELMDSYDEKPQRAKTRNWIKRRHNQNAKSKSVREKFMDYFVNDGAVEWQWKYC